MGILGILSIVYSNSRGIAAVSGGLFFGLRAIRHLVVEPCNNKELAEMLTGIIVFCMMLLYLFFILQEGVKRSGK